MKIYFPVFDYNLIKKELNIFINEKNIIKHDHLSDWSGADMDIVVLHLYESIMKKSEYKSSRQLRKKYTYNQLISKVKNII